MNKLNMESVDIVNENIEKIGELFPNAIVESENGKSIDFDNTQNIYIEGDNLEALKILQESYLNKVKCIYIDPPYNTGNDFIYNDNFNKKSDDELVESGQIDEDGYRLISNNSSNGRFHSDWLSMMYSRIKLSRNLLNDDGVIFISIDDNEVANLIKICDEIFNSNNFEHFIWKKKGGAGNTEKIIGCLTENVICYFKNKKPGVLNYKKYEREYKFSDDFGVYNLEGIEKTNLGTYARPTMLFPIIDPATNTKFYPSNNMRWTLGKETIEKKIKENKIYFDYNKMKVYVKKYESDYEQSNNVYYNLLTEYGSLATAKDEINKLFTNREIFSTPKPTELLKHIIDISSNDNSIILDFFSGSASTADAIMQINAQKMSNKKYIMIQLPEVCQKNSEAFREGFNNICDIGEERIRRSGKKIKENTNAEIDYGFRVYKIDSSNMKDVFYKPNDVSQNQLRLFESNIKEDRTNDDLLTQVILDLGLTLDLKIEEKEINSNKVYYVDNNSLVACFDNNIDINVVDEIAKCNPLKVVFKDESFKLDNDKINLVEKFKKLSPETEISIL